ncbi:MAG TPA: hypothetical protein VKA84_09225 [Gemmatimonadaceae bacterium]|nr:hypothetical protein [Gemmatimonadaceae bacterium]
MNVRRLAALGAIGVCFGIVLLFALFVYMTRPTPSTAGFGEGQGPVLWISVGTIAAALIAVHLVFARQLWEDERNARP